VTFRTLSYAKRPSSTPATIELNRSSTTIIEAVSFAMSVPEPIATPMFARRNAGASLTPSPVTATKWPSRSRASTIASFWSGATRAKTVAEPTRSR